MLALLCSFGGFKSGMVGLPWVGVGREISDWERGSGWRELGCVCWCMHSGLTYFLFEFDDDVMGPTHPHSMEQAWFVWELALFILLLIGCSFNTPCSQWCADMLMQVVFFTGKSNFMIKAHLPFSPCRWLDVMLLYINGKFFCARK